MPPTSPTIGLLQERTARSAEIRTQRMQSALDSRVTIEKVKGVLDEPHGIDVDATLELTRDDARAHW